MSATKRLVWSNVANTLRVHPADDYAHWGRTIHQSTALAFDVTSVEDPWLDRIHTEKIEQTIVGGVTLGMTEHKMFGQEWGTLTTDAGTDWHTRYDHLLTDLESELEDKGVPTSEFEWVIVPIDEPVPRCADHTAGCAPDVSPPEETVLNVRLRAPNYDPPAPNFEVPRHEFFQEAAEAIRNFTPADGLDPQILVNHTSDVSTARLQNTFENCGATGGCVDIWMLAHIMSQTGPTQPHPLSGEPGYETDQFWWYDYDNEVLTTPQRHRQAGIRMKRDQYSGSAQWTMWGANGGVGACTAETPLTDPIDCTWRNAADRPLVPHTWTSTHHDPWHQQNTVYLDDASRPSWVPDIERVSPGRTYFARRQALEFARLLDKLHSTPRSPLTAGAGSTLALLVGDAIATCHTNNSCSNDEATPEELEIVLMHWLHEAYACGTTPDPSSQYTGSKPLVLHGLTTQPWSIQ